MPYFALISERPSRLQKRKVGNVQEGTSVSEEQAVPNWQKESWIEGRGSRWGGIEVCKSVKNHSDYWPSGRLEKKEGLLQSEKRFSHRDKIPPSYPLRENKKKGSGLRYFMKQGICRAHTERGEGVGEKKFCVRCILDVRAVGWVCWLQAGHVLPGNCRIHLGRV